MSKAEIDNTQGPARKPSSALTRRVGSGTSWSTHATILIPALVFFAMMMMANRQLFVAPLVGWGDTALNAIQVQNAKHFQELLGNYSRWHFHHPGPFFFYLFGAGEALLYNLLHIVPAPLNAEYIAQIAFNTTCLFLAIHIFQATVKKPLFSAFAILATVLFLYAVYAAVPYSAVVPIWPPYMTIFCFLLLLSSCASVAAGNWHHIPLLTLSGMIMIHAHVAQLLFVTVLAFMALSSAVLRSRKSGQLVESLHRNRYYLATAFGVFIVFLFPIAIDWAIHNPSNVDQIRAYLRYHHGAHNSISQTLLYTASFFTFDGTPEIALATPSAGLKEILNTSSFVYVYWGVVVFASALAIITHFKKGQATSSFLKFVFIEIAIVTLLFLYWGCKITGPLYNFNGYFFFSVQLFALLALAALLSGCIGTALTRRMQIGLASVFTAALPLAAQVRGGYPNYPDILPIVSLLRGQHLKKVALLMQPQEWPVAAGLADYLNRSGVYFCVKAEWAFMFGSSHVCKGVKTYPRVTVTEGGSRCSAPCSVIYKRGTLYVSEQPPAPVTAK